MDDPMDRGKFPQRPNTPDFWSLVEIINMLDGRATEGTQEQQKASFPNSMSEVVDLNSAIYFAEQRALRILGPNASTVEMAKAVSLYCEGLMVGAHFEQRKRKKRQSGT